MKHKLKAIISNRSVNKAGLLFLFICLISFAVHAQTSVSDTLTVPYESRMDQFEKGNLAPNPSFEKGSKENNTLKLNGWEIKGRNIEWIDKSSFSYSASEVYDSSKSVRIIRKNAGETDPGEGILSDYISVIPGNYQFTLYLKLRNISAEMERLGTKLFDAVDIHLEYYDEQKKPVDPKVWYPYKEMYIDNSFKGFSFSNFWHIDEFDWGLVIGRTYNYPFSEGDIPAGTRFVKIFIGLKGTGTLWVDKVDYRYSKWNFTALERIKPYSENDYTLIDMLVPAPKSITAVKSLRWYDKTKPEKIPVILIPANAEKQTRIAADLLKEKLDLSMQSILGKSYKKGQVLITNRLTDSLSQTASIIFSIGNNELCLRYDDSLPEKSVKGNPQSYYIRLVSDHIIFLRGGSALGDYYAATTLVQLLEEKDFNIQTATIIDQPDFTGRSFLLSAWISNDEVKEDIGNMSKMALWKLNKVYVGYGQPNKQWYNPAAIYKSGVAQAGNYCKKSGLMDLAMMVNPYYHFENEMSVDSISDKMRYTWTHSDPNSLTVLKNVLKLGLDSGARTIMLMADDFVPHEGDLKKNYSLYTPEDKARFINLQNAQAYVINDLHQWLEDKYPGTRFEFCPPWYLNEFIDKSRGKAEQYFADLSKLIPKDISIVWTGNTVRSLSLDMADIFRYKQLIGRYPMLWDNTLYARSLRGTYGGYPAYYPGKIGLCNIFEPLDIFVPQNFYQYNDGPQMYVNGDAFSDCYKIKYMTVADFEWNNGSYNADFSLWKALCKIYGKENALQLMMFNNAYYGLMQVSKLTELGEGSDKDNKAKADMIMKDISNSYSELAKNIGSQKKLLEELRNLKDDQIKNYKTAVEKAKSKKGK